MKRSLWIIILLLAVIGVGATWWLLRSSPHDEALAARELATRKLAEYLARKFPGHRAIVVSNPFTQRDGVAREILAMEKAGVAGVRAGLGRRARVEAVVFPELKPEAQLDPRAVFIDAETTTPLSYLVAEDAFDKLISQHPNCDVVISLVGLPARLDRVRCWTDERPKFALLLPDLRPVGNTAAVKQAVVSGKLAAFVLYRPDTAELSKVAGPLRFEDRFLLVTAENIEQILTDYPQLFPTETHR
ncbi:MAG: hypothetical protein L0Y58_18140 [Verrucomicrobia subdivision 3 bacterium]|nr:hypothetical protein [Limisphaerales bacterium]